MSDNDEGSWKYQLSIRIDGQHLLNVRAETAPEFGANLRSTVEDADLILSACRAMEGRQFQQAPSAVRVVGGVKVSSPMPQQMGPPSGEYGPVLVQGVSTVTSKKDGSPMRSPRYDVNIGGKRISTFDQALGQSAMTLNGKNVFYTTEAKGEFTNLASIRSAP